MSNNECLDHLLSATPGCARTCTGGRGLADLSSSHTCFPPCATLDLSWEVLWGEEGCIQVAGEAKSSVMRLDQFLSQLSRARPDNHRASKGARYQTRQQHRAGMRRRARSRLLAALFFFLFFFWLTSFP